jgi:hypothetical protein
MGDAGGFQGVAMDAHECHRFRLQCYKQNQSIHAMKPVKPTHPPAAEPTPRQALVRTYDAILDPLPQPEVTESDSDTAWGRWEDVMSSDARQQDDDDSAPPAFEDTQPMKWAELPPDRK